MAATKREVWGSDLPVDVVDALDEFASASIDTFGDTLKSILLFGSAAEGRMRATSDVNVLMVFSGIDVARVEAWRAQVESLAAAIDLKPLVLLEDEIAAAAEAFAVKYFDILHRRRVLHGSDPFASLSISKEALGRRVQQVLLNLALRLRQSLLLHNDHARTRDLVDAVGPLRASAVALRELSGLPALPPKDALLELASQHDAKALVERMQALREKGDPVTPDSMRLLAQLIDFARVIAPK
jgi:predicted nucleotidyltransferase